MAFLDIDKHVLRHNIDLMDFATAECRVLPSHGQFLSQFSIRCPRQAFFEACHRAPIECFNIRWNGRAALAQIVSVAVGEELFPYPVIAT